MTVTISIKSGLCICRRRCRHRGKVLLVLIIIIIWCLSTLLLWSILKISERNGNSLRPLSIPISEIESKTHKISSKWNPVGLSGSGVGVGSGPRDFLQRYFYQHGEYMVLANYVRPSNPNLINSEEIKLLYDKTVTFCTQGNSELLLTHLPRLAKRWRAPISVAIYTYDSRDFYQTLQVISYLKQCSRAAAAHLSSEIEQWVTFHVVFNISSWPHVPEMKSILTLKESDYSLGDCSKIPQLNKTLEKKRNKNDEIGIYYPLNILRNIARERVFTEFVLVSDLEFFPGPANLIKMFMKFVKEEKKAIELDEFRKRVFVLPVYEVEERLREEEFPDYAGELLRLVQKSKAKRYVEKDCPGCHAAPFDESKWLRVNGCRVNILSKVHPTKVPPYWQPIYIARTDSPLFDESIQGNHDCIHKQPHPYFVMACFLKYDFYILTNSFLLKYPQDPGATTNYSCNGFRKVMEERHSLIQSSIIPSYHLLYGDISSEYILTSLCEKFLSSNVSAILYLTNAELYGRSTASSQYFLQLADYLGIPVIAWNADNSGLLRRASQSDMILQLAPSVEHQAGAMLSLLVRYNWHQFAIVTSQIAGHDDFVQAVRDRVQVTDFKFIILTTVMVLVEKDLLSLVGSEARILLLYCTREEATIILKAAAKLGLTGSNYVWIVTQSVIANSHDAPAEFPVGMLGVHFNTSYEALKSEISTVLRVFAHGVDFFFGDEQNANSSLSTSLSCGGTGETAKWSVGDRFFRYLKNVSIEAESSPGKPPLEFNQRGTLKSVELQIMNLRPGPSDRQLVWEQIGLWQSWKEPASELDIKDIIWPGYSHKPPEGVPEKFNIKISFLEEPPYVKMADPDPVTGKCSPERGVSCRIAAESQIVGLNHSEVIRNSSYYQCCSGFCIDLLIKFADSIGFTYDLARVPDSKWGTMQNGKWNGLIAELINRKVDLALASLMINAEREAVVDFSVPFMDSGVAILTAKRTGIISPTAFLEPFDPALWMLVCLVGIQAYSLAIFIFEWLSPLGFNMKKEAKPGARFSFFRSCWLVWARLFQASVHIDPPRGFTAKLVVHVWSMFAVVFLATYTANLAVFMITREESHKFVGIHDSRLSNPHSRKPALKFGTVPFTHTDSLLNKHHTDMYIHMKQYLTKNVSEGVAAVRDGQLDAFIYDGPVLQYNVLQDSIGNCSLLIEGSWHAHTGYGLAFPRHSKHLPLFNKFLMEYKENGDLERLSRFYFTGPCSSSQRDPNNVGSSHSGRSNQLALEQFLSAFFLLFCGVLLACFLLGVEHLYSKYVRSRWIDKPPGCFTLISQNMGRAFDHPYGSGVLADQHKKRFGRERSLEMWATECKDPICTTNLLRTQHHLKLALGRCQQLENRLRLVSDPKFRKKRSSCFPGSRSTMTFSELSVSAILSPHEFTRNHHQSDALESRATGTKFREHLYRPSLTEIAEIETVL